MNSIHSRKQQYNHQQQQNLQQQNLQQHIQQQHVQQQIPTSQRQDFATIQNYARKNVDNKINNPVDMETCSVVFINTIDNNNNNDDSNQNNNIDFNNKINYNTNINNYTNNNNTNNNNINSNNINNHTNLDSNNSITNNVLNINSSVKQVTYGTDQNVSSTLHKQKQMSILVGHPVKQDESLKNNKLENNRFSSTSFFSINSPQLFQQQHQQFQQHQTTKRQQFQEHKFQILKNDAHIQNSTNLFNQNSFQKLNTQRQNIITLTNEQNNNNHQTVSSIQQSTTPVKCKSDNTKVGSTASKHDKNSRKDVCFFNKEHSNIFYNQNKVVFINNSQEKVKSDSIKPNDDTLLKNNQIFTNCNENRYNNNNLKNNICINNTSKHISNISNISNTKKSKNTTSNDINSSNNNNNKTTKTDACVAGINKYSKQTFIK